MRFTLLYSDGNSEPHQLVVDDTTGSALPAGANAILGTHGEDFNDGGCVFVIPLSDDPADDLDVMDDDGNEIGRDFLTL